VWRALYFYENGSDCWLTMQTNGNLVVYNTSNLSQWDSQSATTGLPSSSYFAMLQSTGELDVYDFQNDNPTLYKTPVPRSSVDPTSAEDPPSFNISLATIPTLSFDGPYMAIGYYFSQTSLLQNGPFNLTLGTNCTLQSKNGNNTVLWENPSNAAGSEQKCEMTLQQDGNLQIQTSDTNEILWSTNTTGDSSKNWVLYIDSTTGDLSIRDILQPTDILWKNNPPIGSNYTRDPNLNTHSGKRFILELLGVSAGGFLLGITSLVLTYYVCTSKYPKYNCFNSIAFIFSNDETSISNVEFEFKSRFVVTYKKVVHLSEYIIYPKNMIYWNSNYVHRLYPPFKVALEHMH
jgi:hypothetical protein